MEFKKDLIYEQLKREILDRTFYPGMRLPNEKVLARRLEVGQVTLRSALSRLEAENLVERIPGKGTFVSEISARKTFLVILPDGTETLETPSRYVLSGLMTAAEKFSVTLEHCPASLLMSFSDAECREMINRNRISGVILETGHARPDTALVKRIKSFDLPVVIPHGLPEDAANSGFLVLRTDERSAFADGLRTLRDHGHTRVAFLRLYLPAEEQTDIRGFSDAELMAFSRENGLDADMELLVTIPNSQEAINAAVKRWMCSGNPPGAIMCHSDRIAMRVCLALKELNVKIPQELSIMGYSNFPGSQLMIPALSTIDIHLRDCGQMALEQLLGADKWFKKGVTPAEIFTPYEIILRESIARVQP